MARGKKLPKRRIASKKLPIFLRNPKLVDKFFKGYINLVKVNKSKRRKKSNKK